MKRHKHLRRGFGLLSRILPRAKIAPNTPGRNIIASGKSYTVTGGVLVQREYWLHATKGYRQTRA